MREKHVSRLGDMHPTKTLEILVQRDGDVVLAIHNSGSPMEEDGERACIEFCVSGGRSHRVREALYLLVEAIEEENKQNPLPNPF